jgi:hypothetical protein
LLLYRREDLAERWPEELGDELAALNTDVERAVRDHVLRRYGEGGGAEAVRRVVFALVDVPCAAGRRHLVNGEPRRRWSTSSSPRRCSASASTARRPDASRNST